MFGNNKDNFLTYLFLFVKYQIYVCKFQNKKTIFAGYTSFFEKTIPIQSTISLKERENFHKILKSGDLISNTLNFM